MKLRIGLKDDDDENLHQSNVHTRNWITSKKFEKFSTLITIKINDE